MQLAITLVLPPFRMRVFAFRAAPRGRTITHKRTEFMPKETGQARHPGTTVCQVRRSNDKGMFAVFVRLGSAHLTAHRTLGLLSPPQAGAPGILRGRPFNPGL